MTHSTRAACAFAVICGLFCATYEPLGSAIATALLLWALGGPQRDPLWWIAAAATWLRFACIWTATAIRGGIRFASRTQGAAWRVALDQAYEPSAVKPLDWRGM